MSISDLTSNAVDQKDLQELITQHELAAAWSELISTRSLVSEATIVHIKSSIEESVELVRSLEEGNIEVLVTGSLHLVGGLISLLGIEV